jgi:hypothetical protein
MTTNDDIGPLQPAKAAAADLGITCRTIERYCRDPKLNFPQPITINGRNFYAVRQIERWKRDRAARAAT